MRSTRTVITMCIVILLLASLPIVYAASGTSGTGVGIESGIKNLAKAIEMGFENTTNTILSTLSGFVTYLKNILIKVSEIVSICLALVGFFLWFSGINPYSGKRMVISALLLFAFAYVLKYVHI